MTQTVTQSDKEAQFIEVFESVKGKLLHELHKVIIGQDEVIELLLAAMFARGHCLLVGVPGLAKTLHDQHAGQGAEARTSTASSSRPI